jgi:hypothetical protein
MPARTAAGLLRGETKLGAFAYLEESLRHVRPHEGSEILLS